MKSKILLLFILVLTGLSFSNVNAQSKVKITFKYKFINIVEGYDHVSRMQVYVDGTPVGTSNKHRESSENTFTVEVPKGLHTIRAVMETEYEGNWEEHIMSNSYSIDCLFEKTMKFSKKETKFILDFDIDKGTILKKK